MNDKKILNIAKRLLDLAKASPDAFEQAKQPKKFLHVRQDWNTEYSQGGKHYKLPFNRLSHTNQLSSLDAHHQGKQVWQFSDHPKAAWGHESYEVGPEGSLKFVGADYDTSG